MNQTDRRLEMKLERIREHLVIDPQAACRQIEALLKLKTRELHKEGILIGISGGFDSTVAAYLSARAIGHQHVRLLNLPDRDSKAIHRKHAQMVADALDTRLEVKEITTILDQAGIYHLLPIHVIPGKRLRDLTVQLGKKILGFRSESSILEKVFHPPANSLVARGKAYGMAKHRLRMLLLYQEAEVNNLMVVGAANKTELMTGTFSQWGCDQCADVMPLIHLFRSQLYPLARYLDLPREIIEKDADPDILPSIDDKEELLGDFLETDQILAGLEIGVNRDALAKSFGEEAVNRIMRLMDLSRPMRESPYSVNPDEVSLRDRA